MVKTHKHKLRCLHVRYNVLAGQGGLNGWYIFTCRELGCGEVFTFAKSKFWLGSLREV